MEFPKPKTKAAVLAVARSQIGVCEMPINSNKVKYNTEYYGRGVSCVAYVWCVVFFLWVFQSAGFNLFKAASCTAMVNQYKKAAPQQVIEKDFVAGDIVFFDFSGKKKITEHAGICIGVDSKYILTIDGNTSIGNEGNGGMVMIRKRPLTQVTCAIRPNYPD